MPARDQTPAFISGIRSWRQICEITERAPGKAWYRGRVAACIVWLCFQGPWVLIDCTCSDGCFPSWVPVWGLTGTEGRIRMCWFSIWQIFNTLPYENVLLLTRTYSGAMGWNSAVGHSCWMMAEHGLWKTKPACACSEETELNLATSNGFILLAALWCGHALLHQQSHWQLVESQQGPRVSSQVGYDSGYPCSPVV